MIASEVSFNQMRVGAKNLENLAVPTSYMQVEYGLGELEACWDGFVHTSDHYNQSFKNRKEVLSAFANALNEYLEYLGEPASLKVGSAFSSDS
jgi:hypothetical protein